MTRAHRDDFPGAVKHITGRVNGRVWHLQRRGAIQLFLKLLDTALEAFSVELFAYVVMSNHYHLVIRSPAPERYRQLTGRRTACRHFRPWPKRHYKSSVIAQCMRSVLRGVSTALQAEMGASGHFWEERYDARPITDAESFLVRVAYDHRNPVREGIVVRAEDYAWSSAVWWAGKGTSPIRIARKGSLPFGLDLEGFRHHLLRYQEDHRIDDVMQALTKKRLPWHTPEGRATIGMLMEEAGLPRPFGCGSGAAGQTP